MTDPSPEDVEEAATGALAAGASMDLNTRQARFGVVFLRAVAAQAGIPLQETSPGEDVLAIDTLLQFRENDVRVQVKTSRRHAMDPSKPDIRYSAKPEWIEKWAANLHPCYFVVAVVPGDSGDWLDHNDKGTTLAGVAAYWTRIDAAALRTLPVIVVPKAQRLGVETLTQWHEELLGSYGGGGQ